MGRNLLRLWSTLALLTVLAAPAAAEGLLADRVQATFGTNRKGAPQHSVKVRGMVTDTSLLRTFRPEDSGLLLRVGDFVAVSHTPGDDGSELRLKRDTWKLSSNVNGTRTRLRIDTRSGALRLQVKKANASLLQAGGPDYAVVRLELGSRVLEDAVVFDVRRRGGALQWKSLARGAPVIPPPPKPDGKPLPGGTLPYTILSRGEQSKQLQPGIIVARSQAEWEALYGQATFTVPNQRPGVDFTQEMVIGVFTGLVSQIHAQEIDVVNVTDDGTQLHVSWRSRFLCTQFACTGGLQGTTCPDFSPFVFVRVRRVESEGASNRAPSIYADCP